jgi:hypothetical protein
VAQQQADMEQDGTVTLYLLSSRSQTATDGFFGGPVDLNNQMKQILHGGNLTLKILIWDK